MNTWVRIVSILVATLTAACGSSGGGTARDAAAGGGGGGGAAGGGGGSAGGAGPSDGAAGAPSVGLAELIRRYEMGAITRAELGARLADYPASPRADALRGAMDEIVLLRARAMPYVIAADLQMGAQGVLVIEAGASVIVGAGVTVTINGKLYALGTAAKPITIAAPSKTSAYKTILLAGGRSEIVGAVMRFAASLLTVKDTGKTPILVEESQLDDFTDSGIEMMFADGLVIRKNQIGVQTKPEDAKCEALHGTESGVLIEGNTFGRRAGYNDVFDLQPCKTPHNPIIVGNEFLGGDDDAIDLDDCDAIIVGNHLKDFRPGPTAAGAANGGGVTGAGGSAIVISNVIENCVHAIGFKDDARPLVLNNTIINNDIGITMYSANTAPAASGVAINNLLWNNKTDVILDGHWFKDYNPTKMGSLEASHNVVKDSALTGKGDNVDADPLLELKDGVPTLRAGSPARGSGFGDVAALAAKTIFSPEVIKRWLEKDYAGNPRTFEDGKFAGIDRGAIQNK